MELQAPQQLLAAEGECGMSSLLVPSPQSEAVTHEMEELSLQPSQNLPPLNERKNVLQLRLQQRRTREQLVEQGIMPPLKSPAAFHGQIRSLERARTENFLKHKIRSRPERAELVRMHILQETGAEPSLQATQMKLKRARLADNLNEKIAQRPGPMELVEKNIIPVDSTLKQAIIVGQMNYSKVVDEDSSDALSPEQPASQESQSSAPSPGESRGPETPSPVSFPMQPLPTNTILQTVPLTAPATTDFLRVVTPCEPPVSRTTISPVQPATTVTPSKPGPTLIKQSQQKLPSEKSRSKKGKEPKSRVKKLKYHQYVPPDQKQEASEVSMDSSYARLLQQQQLFLQLQILSQQQQHYNYQTILPAPLKPVAEGQSSAASTIVVSLPTAPPPPPPLPPASSRPNNPLSNRKPGVLPANLEEMKVAELKLELKLRGLPVSGTKTDLIERLKPFQDSPPTTNSSPAPPPAVTTITSMPMEVSTTPAVILPAQQVTSEHMSSSPPVSPNPSDIITIQQDVAMSSEVKPEPPLRSAGPIPPVHSVPEEKDRRLHEKERQIEELMKKLEEEQKLVEELKMQLEVEKRGGGSGSLTDNGPVKLSSSPLMNSTSPNSFPVKAENAVLSSCSPTTNSILDSFRTPLQNVVKLEDVTVSSGKPIQIQAQTHVISQIQPQIQTPVPVSPQPFHQIPQSQSKSPGLQQFFISHSGGVSQVLGQPQTILTRPGQPLLTTTGQTGTQILLPVSLPNNTATIQLPSTTVGLQPILQATISNPGQVPASAPLPQSQKLEKATGQQVTNHTPLMQTLTMCNNTAASGTQTRPEVTTQCFLRSSPENCVSPRSSPNHHISNGPLNKSSPPSHPAFILQSATLVPQPPKTREPPRYEEAVKQSRNQMPNNDSLVSTASSQQMDDLFDILIQSGEITPFAQPEPPVSLNKTVPVKANVTTLPFNTALSRHPPQIQVAPPPTLSPLMDPSLPGLSSLATDNQLEAFLEGTLADTASDPRTHALMEELQAQLMEQQPYSPMDTSDLSFSSSPPSSLNMGLSDPTLDNMEWLDLTMPPVSGGALTPLGISADLLDHDLQLHWD
ncbi:myocardin-related transcription factor B [Synchiropus splendidus]|uniref:myocardin-related transcription factor B n=1 Tax=Synchiropus splendidus TaxID=270530 RepID=UPI00237E9E9A|nr:myocardin-related transcription factor B [Synchiropus splendidus]XP_053722802.1 myocardin-related transcription factor B [Synchiropus splendidus]XP_053722810.1 myocardin-related transcription factor B [Synchiropus splendidus]